MQFTKLFSCILDSTIWQEPPQTKILWITMLAMSDRNGEVHASVPGLAKRAGITMDECQKGIACLLAPDPYSRTRDHEGRRVAVIDGGWILLNHAKYRALLSAEERREYNRRKQAEFRAKSKASANVNDSQQKSAMSAHTEAESEAEADKKNPPISPQGGELPLLAPPEVKPTRAKITDEELEPIYQAYPSARRGGRLEAFKAIRKAMAYIAENPERFGPLTPKAYLSDAVKAYATSSEVRARIANGEGQYLPMLSRWMNAGRFDAPMGQAPAGTPVKAFVSPEPPNWRAIIDREFPKSAYAGITTPWAKLSVSDRDCITQAIKPYQTAA